MNRTKSGLWVAHGFHINQLKRTEKTVTLPNGERAKVTIDDSGTVMQVEEAEHLHAIVRPAPIVLRRGVGRIGGTQLGGFANPGPIRKPLKTRRTK